jgi:hypothetical protein
VVERERRKERLMGVGSMICWFLGAMGADVEMAALRLVGRWSANFWVADYWIWHVAGCVLRATV